MPDEGEDETLASVGAGRRATERAHPPFMPAALFAVGALAMSLVAGRARIRPSGKRVTGKLTYVSHVGVVERAQIPRVVPDAFAYRQLAGSEQLGWGIIEAPTDFKRFELRDPPASLF